MVNIYCDIAGTKKYQKKIDDIVEHIKGIIPESEFIETDGMFKIPTQLGIKVSFKPEWEKVNPEGDITEGNIDIVKSNVIVYAVVPSGSRAVKIGYLPLRTRAILLSSPKMYKKIKKIGVFGFRTKIFNENRNGLVIEISYNNVEVIQEETEIIISDMKVTPKILKKLKKGQIKTEQEQQEAFQSSFINVRNLIDEASLSFPFSEFKIKIGGKVFKGKILLEPDHE